MIEVITKLRDGKFVPTFPNARYIYPRKEYERWNPRRPDYQAVDYNEGVFECSVQPIIDAGLGDVIDDNYQLSQSVNIEPAYGHTRGHTMLHVNAAGEEVYFTGDVFHHPLQILYPELHLPGCDDLDTAIATRRRVATLCAERGAVLIPAHFADPHIGYVKKEGEQFSFEPLTLQK